MAVTHSLKVANNSSSDASSYDTASITPTADTLILAAILSHHGSAVPNAPTLSGNSLTWVQIATVTFNTIGTSRSRLTVFRAMGASPSSGAVTIDFDGQTQISCGWIISEFGNVITTGSNGANAIIQSQTNNADAATSLTVTLGAFNNSLNATYGAFSHDGFATAVTNGTGFTEISEQTTGVEGKLQSEWRNDNDTSVDANSSITSRDWGGIAIEIGEVTTETTTSTTTSITISTSTSTSSTTTSSSTTKS